MKKKELLDFCNHESLKQTHRIMRQTLFFLLFFALQSFGISSYSQGKALSLNLKKASLKEVVQAIEKQSEYVFIYRDELIASSNKVTIDVKNASLEQVLNQVLNRQNLEYKISDRQVILKAKPAAPASQQQQSITVKGKITSSDGAPIPGANIIIKGTLKGVTTDSEGNYSLDVPDNAVLQFSFVGFKTTEEKISGRTTINIKLDEEVSEIDQVVVTGIFSRKTESYTGSATTVKATELQQFGSKNVITSLRNIDPSFNIIESNAWGSNPNRQPEIQIRGNSSIPNVGELQDETRVGLNTPLIVLDGFQTNLQRLLDINENDVESITILKDASATAIYGSRGSNGVIVITTKAPKMGKLRVSVKSDVNLEIPDLTGYNYLDAKEKLELETKVGLYQNAFASVDVPLKKYYNEVLSEVNRGVDTYWLSIPLRTGIGQKHNIRLEGGDSSFRFSIAAQVNNLQGVMKESGRNIFNGTINLSYYLKSIRFTNSLMIGLNKSAESPYGSFSDYTKMNPYWRAYDENGNVIKELGNYGSSDYYHRWNTLPTNPLYNATLNMFDTTNSSSIINNLSVEWNITQDIKLRGRLGLSKTNGHSDKFKPADHTDFAKYAEADMLRKGSYEYETQNSFDYEGSLNLSINKTLKEKHSIYAGIDLNMRQEQLSKYLFTAEGFTNANLDFISMALQYQQNGKPKGSESLVRAAGFTTNLNYTYDNRYFGDFSFRTDGSSQFGSKNRFAPFWSTGLGWNIHKESFFYATDIVDRLKLRASVGTTGSQNFNAYQALSTYRYYSDDRYFNWLGAYKLGMGNDKLKWEQKMKYNLGIESQFFQNRVSFTADMYIETTENLVSSVSLPTSSGFKSYVENIGKNENRGFELKSTVFIYKNPLKKFSWSVTAALIHNKNKLIELSKALKDAQNADQQEKADKKDYSTLVNPNILYREGYSKNTIWVVESLGIDPGTGKEVFVKQNGDMTYVWDINDLKPMGVAEPKYMGNINSTARYKSFSLNVSLGYRLGGQLYNQTLIDKVENADYSYNVDSRVFDNRWQKPGDIAAFKGLMVTDRTLKSSRFIQDENTLTCQNINLRYDFEPKGFISKLKLENLTLSADVSNLFYISTVKQERGTHYPFSRQLSFGVTAIF